MDFSSADLFDNVSNEPDGSGGGGKGGGAAGGGSEAPNTLRSKAMVRLLYLIGEGEIVGLTNAAKSLIINKVPYENPDGTTNFNGVTWALNTGTPDQAALPGFEAVTAEYEVNLRVRADGPIVYRTTSAELDAIIATINIPQLSKLDAENGSLNGYHLEFEIDVKNLSNPANVWVNKVANERITGKCTSPYERSYRLDVTGPGPWLVRIRRISPDSDEDSKIADQLYFSHVTEVSDYKVAYADSAILGAELDVEQLGNSADLRFDIKGKKINYPANYNPETRTFTGFWNGTFSHGFCNDPAWVLMDVLLNPRYGLGLPMALIDKWGLYQLSQFCSAQVPDGFGGTEPRFTFNGTFYSQEDAYKTVQSIASMMRSIVFYGAGAVLVRHDAPMSPEQRVYTQANVVGDFSYSSSANSVRHNACIVQWQNPDLGYEADYEVYEDRDSIIKFGYNPVSIKAIGTTSRGQAYRQGKWFVLTEQLQTDTVTFEAGADSASVLPGDIIEIADPHWATADFGGRINQQEGRNKFTTNPVMGGWSISGAARGTERSPGPLGARNLLKHTASAGLGLHYISRASGLVPTVGQKVSLSIFVRGGDHDYVFLRITGTGTAMAAVQLSTGNVRRIAGVAGTNPKVRVEKHGPNLYRLVLTSTATISGDAALLVGFDSPGDTTVLASVSLANWTALGTEVLYLGNAQAEIGEATPYEPIRFNGTTNVALDRDIDYTGATSPQLHITLLTGPVDDIANVDNTDRPIKREIRYFSSNIIGYEPETQMVTLQTAISAAGNDEETPLVWIFSKTQQAPRAYKVISNEENTEDGTYTISALQYVPEKFTRMDEGFRIDYDPGSNYSNIPTTSYCAPPSRLRVEESMRTGVRQLNISWEQSPDQFLSGYLVSYKFNDDNWVQLPQQLHNHLDIDAQIGNYVVSVRAINRFGVPSEEVFQGLQVNEINPSGQAGVIAIFTDRGDNTFTDRNIRLFWTSRPLSATAETRAIRAVLDKPPSTVTTNAEGQAEVQGGVGTPSTGTIAASIANPAAPTITFGGSFKRGDTAKVFIGQSIFSYTSDITRTATSMASQLATIIQADPRFSASATSGVITITFVNGATNANNLAASDDPLFRRFRVRVIDPATSVQKRIEYTTTPEITYTYATNQQDFVSPARSVRFAISVEDITGSVSAETLITMTNPAPVPVAVTVNAVPGVVTMRYTPPNDPDFAGMVVYMSTVSGFTPGESNRVFQDRGNPAIPVTSGTTYYYRYGFLDAFGEAGIALSAQQTIFVPTVTSTDLGIPSLSAPTWPATPLTSATTVDPVTRAPLTTLTISWLAAPNTPANVASYQIEVRETTTGNWIGGFAVPGDTTTLRISDVTPNQRYQARVRAVNGLGAFSAWSTIAPADPGHLTAKDSVAPQPPTSVAAVATFRSIFLSWVNSNNAADTDLAQVEIWENTTNNSASATRVATVNALMGANGGWTRNVSDNTTRYYWLKSVDTSGNVSAFHTAATTGVAATPISIPTTDISGTLTATHFPTTLRPTEVVSVLPSSGNFDGRIVFLTTDGKIYRYTGGAWSASTAAADIAGTLAASNFASTLRPVEVVGTLPSTGNFAGRMAFLTTDNKLYRHNGTAWTAAIPTADLTGTISTLQIADNAVTDAKVAGLAAAKVTGQLTDAQIAAVGAAKLTGQITGTQITDGAISTPKILAGSVTTATLAAGAVTADQIAANAITAASISAGAITAAKIAAGAITANEIAAGTILAGNIAASAITADLLAVNSVTADKITANAVTADKIAANAVTAGKIIAGAISATHIAAKSITTEKMILAGGNLVANGSFETGDTANWRPWNSPQYLTVAAYDPTASPAVYSMSMGPHPDNVTSVACSIFAAAAAYSDANSSNDGFVVEPGREYHVSLDYKSAGFSGSFVVIAYFFKSDGTWTTNLSAVPQPGVYSSTWASMSGSFVAPTGALRCWLYVRATSWTSGRMYFTNLRAYLKNAADLIVDGAITANKLAANSVTAGKILAGEIAAGHIAAGAILASKVAIGDTSNMIPDPNLVDPAAWVGSSGAVYIHEATTSQVASSSRIVISPDAATKDVTLTLPIPVEANKDYYVSAAAWVSSGLNGKGQVLLGWYSNAAGTVLIGSHVIVVDTTSSGITRSPTTLTAPATARSAKIIFRRIVAGTNAANAIFAEPIMRRAANGELIVDGSITAAKIAANTITANEIAAGTITSDRIAAGTIQGDRISTTTSLPGTITVGSTGVTITTVESRAADPAARVNAGTTQIDPGRILISGSTTLSNWRNGADVTKIEGGSIAANTITANKIEIGVRGITIEGLEFEANRGVSGTYSLNRLRWSAGSISYIDDTGTVVTVAIAAGQTGVAPPYYISWLKGATTLTAHVSSAAANVVERIPLAVYYGGADLVVLYGRTVIDGTKISTDTIEADRIKTGTVFAQDIYIGGSRFGLRGAIGGAGKGALVVTASDNQTGVELVRLGWLDSTNVGFRVRNSAGNIVLDHTYNPIESGADVTRYVDGSPSDIFKYSSTGVAESGELPRSIAYKLMASSGQVTSGVTWTYKVIAGTVNGFTQASAAQAMTGTGTGTFTVTTLGTDTAIVEIRATFGGSTKIQQIALTKEFAAAPVGGGGGTQVLASKSSGFTSISSTTFTDITGTLTGLMPTGKTVALLKANLSAKPVTTGGEGTWTVELKWQRNISSTWTDQGATPVIVSGNSEVWDADSPNGIFIASSASLPLDKSVSGLTAGTSYQWRLVARLVSGTRVHAMTGSCSVEV